MVIVAKEFLERQETTARETGRQLKEKHAVRAKSALKSAAHNFMVGDPVWVLRPQPLGTHRPKTWFTPAAVGRGIDEDTYPMRVGPGQLREPHKSQLRPRKPDVHGKHVSLDYAVHKAHSDNNYAEPDSYTV